MADNAKSPELRSSKTIHKIVRSGTVVAWHNLRRQFVEEEDAPSVIDEAWPLYRRVLAKIAYSTAFQAVMAVVLCTHFAIIIRETDIDAKHFANNTRGVSTAFHKMNLFLLGYYIVELLVRFLVHQGQFFHDGWNIFDFAIVISDVIMHLLELLEWNTPTLWMLRLFRLVKMVRAARLSAKFRMLKEFSLMVSAFVNTMKAILWACVLLVIVLLFWSVLAVQLLYPLSLSLEESGAYDGCPRCPKAFSSVFAAFITLLQTTIAGDSWGQTAVPMIEAAPWTAAFFVTVLASLVLGMMNLVLMVIVDRAHEVREQDVRRKTNAKSSKLMQLKAKLLQMLESLDTDKSGTLSEQELMGGYEKHFELQLILERMDIYREDVSEAFSNMRQDEHGEVKYEQLVDQLQHLKHHDSHTMLMIIRHCLKDLQDEIQLHVERKLIDHLEKSDKMMDMIADIHVQSHRIFPGMLTEMSTVEKNIGFAEKGKTHAVAAVATEPFPTSCASGYDESAGENHNFPRAASEVRMKGCLSSTDQKAWRSNFAEDDEPS